MELLIQVSRDPVRPTVHPVGDVIAAMPDGHLWGREELAHPHWRIVRVPGMTRAEADSLTAPEVPRHGQKSLHLRGVTVDVAALGLADQPRAARLVPAMRPELTADRASFRAAVSVKPASS